MDDGRQPLATLDTDPAPLILPWVHGPLATPQSKPGRPLPHPIEAARRSADTTPPGLAEQGDRFHARPTEV